MTKDCEAVPVFDEAALTELFAETRNGDTPVIVERIVADIDNIVRIVRFPG